MRVFYVHSNQHVPGFITQAEQLKAKGVDEILLISVNDPFVMKAWAKTYPENKHVKFLADGSGAYTKALDLELDLTFFSPIQRIPTNIHANKGSR